MISVGLTGGIGSGKTTVAKIWQKMGASLIYADDLAKEMMRKDKGLKKKLINTFGSKTYTPDGELNKPYLIQEAFHKNRVDELNDIVHPSIRRKILQIIQDETKAGTKILVYEAAILLNEGRPNYLDKIVVVLSDRDERISRVVKRDETPEKEIIARMEKQPSFEQMTHLSDIVIKNDGTLEDLEKKAKRVYNTLVGIA